MDGGKRTLPFSCDTNVETVEVQKAECEKLMQS